MRQNLIPVTFKKKDQLYKSFVCDNLYGWKQGKRDSERKNDLLVEGREDVCFLS